MESRALTAAMAVIALLLAAIATLGPLEAVAAFVMAVLVTALATFGRERVAIAALAGMFATAPMYRGIGGIGDIATPTDVLLVLGLFLLLPELIQRQGRLPSAYLISIGAIAVTGLLGSAANSSPIASAVFVLQWLLCLGVLPAALATWNPGRQIVDGLLWCYLAGTLVSTGVALTEGPGANGRYDGLAHHPNDFGLAGGVAIAIVLYLMPTIRSMRIRMFLAVVFLISLWSVILSGSRAVTLAVAIVIVFIPIVERSSVWTFLGLASGALGIALLPYLIHLGGEGGSLSRLTGDATSSYSDNLRETALAEGWHRFLSSPYLGSGLDGDVATYHNVFLEAAVAVGVFGLLAYLVICYLLTRPLFTSHPLRRLSYIPLTFVVAGTTFPGIVDRTIAVPMALAIMAAVRVAPAPVEGRPPPILRGMR